jgi:cell division protein FtsB
MACLTGILILVALLIAMDGLTDEMEATPGKSGVPNPEVAAARVPVLREQIAILQRSIDDRKGGRDVTKAEVDLLDYSIKDKAMLMERARKRLTDTDAEMKRITAEQAAATQQIEELRERIVTATRAAEAQVLRERVKFRPGMKYPKAPVFVEPMTSGVVLGELDATRTPVRIADLKDPNADARIVGELAKRLPDTSYIVFVVHEDAIQRFETLRNALIRRGYEVGWQLWDGAEGGFLDGASESTGPVPLILPAVVDKPSEPVKSGKSSTGGAP